MVSLELAKKLKDAGLVWEPKKGDAYIDYDDKTVRHVVRNKIAWSELYIYLPSLSQLLAGLDKKDVAYVLCNQPIVVCQVVHRGIVRLLNADTPDDAAASALLWILEREKGG